MNIHVISIHANTHAKAVHAKTNAVAVRANANCIAVHAYIHFFYCTCSYIMLLLSTLISMVFSQCEYLCCLYTCLYPCYSCPCYCNPIAFTFRTLSTFAARKKPKHITVDKVRMKKYKQYKCCFPPLLLLSILMPCFCHQC